MHAFVDDGITRLFTAFNAMQRVIPLLEIPGINRSELSRAVGRCPARYIRKGQRGRAITFWLGRIVVAPTPMRIKFLRGISTRVLLD